MFLMASAGIAAWFPLNAGTVDFWNKKAPAEWTDEEIDRLISKSPWAKLSKAQYAPGEENYDEQNPGSTSRPTGPGNGGGYPGGGPGTGGGYPGGGGGGYPGGGRPGGGIGIPGIGGLSIPGLGRKRGNGGGGAPSPYEGTVRWESARPILEAMKAPLPEAFAGHYVISVNGIPLLGARSTRSGDEDDGATARRHEQDDLDRVQGSEQSGGEGPGSAAGRTGHAPGGHGIEFPLRVFTRVAAA